MGLTAGRLVKRVSGTGLPDTDFTLGTHPGVAQELLWVTVRYSDVVSESIFVRLRSGVGSSFDMVIELFGIVGIKEKIYVPPRGIFVVAGDKIEVFAGAGGLGITATVAIYTWSA